MLPGYYEKCWKYPSTPPPLANSQWFPTAGECNPDVFASCSKLGPCYLFTPSVLHSRSHLHTLAVLFLLPKVPSLYCCRPITPHPGLPQTSPCTRRPPKPHPAHDFPRQAWVRHPSTALRALGSPSPQAAPCSRDLCYPIEVTSLEGRDQVRSPVRCASRRGLSEIVGQTKLKMGSEKG